MHYGFHDLDSNELDGTAGKGPGVYDVSVGNRILLQLMLAFIVGIERLICVDYASVYGCFWMPPL